MASLLFVMRYPLDEWDNLKNKFDGQMNAARALGHIVYHIGWDHKGMWLMGGDTRELLRKSRLTRMPAYCNTKLCMDLMDAVKEAVSRKKIDLIYMRFMPTFRNTIRALRIARERGAKIVVEHPTYPFVNGQITSLLRKPVFWYTGLVMKKIEPMIDLYTLIGDPCDGVLNGRPAMNIANGVEVEHFPLHAPCPEDSVIHLLALASMSHWQGYDRLIASMALYRGDADVVLHMVGNEGDGSLAEWKRMSKELGVSRNVIFHGEMHGEELNALVAGCDVGVGGLGLYRKAQFCSMTLKLREYMVRGLPFIYAVNDPSVPDEPRFCLRVPNDGSVLDLEKIIAFAKKVKLDMQAPAEMNEYAREHMSWQGILKGVLERVDI